MEEKRRAYELDLMRGIAIVMMLFIHFSWDLRYEFGNDACGYLTSKWYHVFFHPLTLVLFIGVSGICCTLSRNNFRRGLKMLVVALMFTAVTSIIRYTTGIDCLILFNVLHILAIGILLFALTEKIEKRLGIDPSFTNIILGIIGVYMIMIGMHIGYYRPDTDNLFLLPIGVTLTHYPSMADYIPLFPWLGIFFVGAAVGRSSYADHSSKLPERNDTVRKLTTPIEFLGRHSLIIYIVHQPIMYGLLALIVRISEM